MGWSLGQNSEGRDVGYGVPATCDHPDCNAEIDRGISHVCGGEPDGGEDGCGLFFCGDHLTAYRCLCDRCSKSKPPFEPKPDHPEWMRWKLTDESWQQWRDENPDEVAKMRAALGEAA
jgi:hypothetical protein